MSDLIERLEKRASEWDAKVDGWLKQAEDAGQKADAETERVMRGTIYREAADEIERLQALLVKEREENLWNAYHTGHVERGDWTHMFMSDGEWLARECGFDPTQGHYADAAIRSAIPEAARKVLKGDT